MARAPFVPEWRIGGPIAYPLEAVLNIKQVAEWLQVSVRTVERLDIPFTLLGRRTKRYVAADVLAFLASGRISAP